MVMVLGMVVVVAPQARAYGNPALWQIGMSVGCDNQALCLQPPFGVGGIWGWIDFDTGGLGDATLAGCSHLSTSIGVLTGATSINIDITQWSIGPGSAGPFTFLLEDGTVTNAGTDIGGVVTLPLAALLGPGQTVFDTGVPAAAGHCSFASVMGFSAPPGVNYEIQVNQLAS